MRRKAISPFFSAAKITDFQSVIHTKVDKFCRILSDHQDGQVVRLSRGWMALTTDIITEYAFAKSYNQLDSPGFTDTLHEALVAIYTTGHFALHFPIVFPILDKLPDWFVRATQPAVLPVVGLRKDLAKHIREIREGINQRHRDAVHPTIFHELLLNANLPESEKTDARLGDEAQLIIAAGLITTSWALNVASFHLAKNPDLVSRLRSELATTTTTTTNATAAVGRPVSFNWHDLEKLPFLNSCVREAIRLSHGIVTRDPRIAPDVELLYPDPSPSTNNMNSSSSSKDKKKKWKIPRGTPVSMTTVDILMNEEIFPDPKNFIPERWIDNPELERYFVPFGKGSRQCLGIKSVHPPIFP